MVNRSHDDDELLALLQQLPREMPPPTRVGVALAHAMNRAGTTSRHRAWAGLAALLIVGAFLGGRLTAPRDAPAAATARTFALLLYGGGDGGSAAVAEYRAWASNQRSQGRAVRGERLGQDSWIAGGTPGVDPLPLRGFFLIEAKDSVEAIEVARHHPHASDGTIVIRPVTTP